MKNYKLMSLLCVLVLSVLTAGAQTVKTGFSKLTWDEACAEAARSGKMVMVDVMRPMKDPKIQKNMEKSEQKMFASPGVADFMKQHVVAIRMDMTTEAGKAFAPKLQMNMYPTYGFFMPDGSLLKVVSPFLIMQKPEMFMKTAQEAWDMAEVKKANTRSIEFKDIDFKDAVAQAKKEGKLIFVDAYTDPCQPCIMMAKNVFTLNKVADFYNANFINLKINFGNIRKDLAEQYGTSAYPAYLFINGDGKLVYKAGGYTAADKFIGYGEEALKKAKGIEFFEGTWAQALEKARQENRVIFMDCYTSWCAPCKMLAKEVFTDPDVAALFNEKFVNVKVDMEKGEGIMLKDKFNVTAFPTLIFVDGNGALVHRIVGSMKVPEFMNEAQKVVDGKGLVQMQAAYQQGNREPQFIQDYMVTLDNANWGEEAEKVCMDYFNSLDKTKLQKKEYWDLFKKYIKDINSDVFRYVYDNRVDLGKALGDKEVRSKIATVYAIKSNSFVDKTGEKPVLDSKGFNRFVKQLSKADVQGKEDIIRNARMNNAENIGDWKTYIQIGAERLKDGGVPDLLLYNWGLRVNKLCKDPVYRLQAAQWFDDAAARSAKAEQEGKVKMMSYKTYFERIAKDLKAPVK